MDEDHGEDIAVYVARIWWPGGRFLGARALRDKLRAKGFGGSLLGWRMLIRMRPYSGDIDLHVDGRLMRGLRVGGRAQKITLGTAGNGDRLGQASKSDGGRREDHAVEAVSRCSKTTVNLELQP